MQNLINDPFAVLNSVNSSPYFRQLHENQLVQQLFPQVIKVLITRNERNSFRVYTTNEKDDDDEEDEICCGDGWFSYRMFRKSILSCRLVCSAWNSAVENVYQNLLFNELTAFQK